MRTLSGTARRRSASGRSGGITDLFLGTKERLSEEQIEVFDEVLCHLITRMEARALIELSERLAPINNAPNNVIHTLAVDDEIAIAGPVLSLSDRLTTPDLVEIAMAKGQSHLLAISQAKQSRRILDRRPCRDEAICKSSPHLPRMQARSCRKKRTPIWWTSPRPTRRFLEKLGLRLDIPLHIFRRLLQRVSEAVRARILALASPEKRDDIAEILASISNDVVQADELDRDFVAAERRCAADA